MKTLKKLSLVTFLIGSMLTSTLIIQGHAPVNNASESAVLTNAPSVSAGDDATICDSEEFKTKGIASYVGTTYWVTDGDGTFNNPFNLKTVYKPGPHDKADGQVTLKLYVVSKAMGAVIDPMMDEMILYLNKCINSNMPDEQ